MTTRLKAKFDGKVLIPQEPVNLPQDRSLTVVIEETEQERTLDTDGHKSLTGLANLAQKLSQYPPNPDSPGDLAAQHDHYLYGTPKRPNP